MSANGAPTGEIVQPVQTSQIVDRLHQPRTAERFQLGTRTVQNLVGDLETMGLVDTWMESAGRDGRSMQIETTFDPKWVHGTQADVAAALDDDGG